MQVQANGRKSEQRYLILSRREASRTFDSKPKVSTLSLALLQNGLPGLSLLIGTVLTAVEFVAAKLRPIFRMQHLRDHLNQFHR